MSEGHENLTNPRPDAAKIDHLYKPLLLRLGDVEWLNPVRVFLLFAMTTGSIAWIMGTTLLTPIVFAYALAICNYLVKRHRSLLSQLVPVLTISETQVEKESYRLSHFKHYKIIGAALVGPFFMLVVNWSNPELQATLSGAIPSGKFVWSLILATATWIIVLQIIAVILSNTLQFSRLGRTHTRIDLLDTETLTPYTMVGISNILLFTGAYSIVPLAIVDSSSVVRPALMSLFVTLPIALVLLILPIESIRMRIREAKNEEVRLVTLGIHGDRDALKKSHLADEADTISVSSLVSYRETIENIREWPFSDSALVRLSTYVIIPVLAWIAASLVDRLVEYVL